jgi:3-hydroxybutyryl-CoA dehydrogenase
MEISIIGSGVMGRDISLLLSQSKHIRKINLVSPYSDFKKKQTDFKSYLSKKTKELEKRYNTNEFKKIKLTSSLKVVKNNKFLIETIIENKIEKEKLIKELNKHVDSETLLFSNSSSLDLRSLKKHFKFQENFFGMHFFNPVVQTKLIELIYINKKQKKVLEFYKDLFLDLKKQIIIIEFFPGYIVNRILLAQINEACFILENNILSAKEIDDAYKAATSNFKGPFQISDLIGNDVVLNMLNNLFSQTEDHKFKPNKTLKEMVKNNKLGNKTKSGFYKDL